MIPFTCTKCDICTANNYTPLIGDGNLNANIMFVTKNPSTFEIKNNVPLVDKSGLLFQKYLDLFNFSRDIVYITNCVKCRTPSNRLPTDTEIYNCRDYLEQEINEVKPKIIMLLGNTAIRSYFKLAYTVLGITAEELNANYMIHDNKIIIFSIHPINGLYYPEARKALFNSFITLVKLYRIINPGHTTNISSEEYNK